MGTMASAPSSATVSVGSTELQSPMTQDVSTAAVSSPGPTSAEPPHDGEETRRRRATMARKHEHAMVSVQPVVQSRKGHFPIVPEFRLGASKVERRPLLMGTEMRLFNVGKQSIVMATEG